MGYKVSGTVDKKSIVEKIRNARWMCLKVNHVTLDVKSVTHIVRADIMAIHEGMTSQIQVLVNNPLKDNLQQIISLGRGQWDNK
jgi:hypothetical protein